MERLQKQVAEKVVEVFGGGARLAGLYPLAGDASSRRYFRAVLQPPAAPSSVIVMTWTDVGMPISSDELAVFSEPLDELPFLNVHRFLEAAGARVPAVYGHWVGQGLMLLEDLGDVCLWDRVREAPEAEVIRWYRKAIDELVVLQIGGTQGPEMTAMHGIPASLRPSGFAFGSSPTSSSTAWKRETRGACRRRNDGYWTRRSRASPGIFPAGPVCSITGTTIAGTSWFTTTPWWSSTFRTRCWPRPNTISLRC